MAFVKYQLTAPQVEGANGDPLVGGSITAYLWDTSTPTPMYTNAAGDGADTSFTLNTLGNPQTDAGTAIDIFLNTAITYKFIIRDSAGTQVGPTIGPVYPAGGTGNSSEFASLEEFRASSFSGSEAVILAANSGTTTGRMILKATGTSAGTPTLTAARFTALAAGEIINAGGYGYAVDGELLVDHLGLNASDAHPALQAYIDACDVYGYGWMRVPLWGQDLYLSDSIKLNLGDFRIFSEKGMQYRHPFTDGTDRLMRKGDLVIRSSAPCALDVGDYQTGAGGANPSRNLAMSFTIDHLAIRGETAAPASGTPYASDARPNAIEISGLQNGPHRPYKFEQVSAYNVKSGFYIAGSVDTSINVATLDIENCVVSFSHRGIFSEGKVFGAKVSGCNLEANMEGCVWGDFNGSLILENNMMENTKNPVNLEPTASLSLRATGNYFEYHPTSDYLFRVVGADYYNEYDLDVRGNITSGSIPAGLGLDVSGNGLFTINTQFPVKLKNTNRCVVRNGSRLIGNTGYYDLVGMSAGINHAVFVDGGLNRTDDGGEWLHFYPDAALPRTMMQTPFGPQYVADLADGFRFDAGETIQNKLVVINLLLKAEMAGFTYQSVSRAIQARTTAGAFVNGPANIADFIAKWVSGGEWVLVSIPFRVTSNVQIFEWFVEAGLAGVFKVAGATLKVYGAYTPDGSAASVKIYPKRPNFT